MTRARMAPSVARSIPLAGLALSALTMAGCRQTLPVVDPPPAVQALTALHVTMLLEWEQRLQDDPLLATSVGVHDFDDRMPSRTPTALAHQDAQTVRFLGQLRGIDRERLAPDRRVDLDLLIDQLEARRREYEFGGHLVPVQPEGGFHTALARLPLDMPFADALSYRNYLSRLRDLPRYVDEQIAWMREGLATGMTQPREILDGIEAPLEQHLVEDPEASVFFGPFRNFPDAVPEADRAALASEARDVIAAEVLPTYRRLHAFLRDEYRPGARTTLGASELPRGAEFYAWRVRHFTTLDLTPQEVHDLGLAEVARIRAEMEQVMRATGFEGDFTAFLEFLRTDPRFYPTSGEQLLDAAREICRRMEAQLPDFFGHLPERPYVVEPVPDDIAPRYTAGRYVEAPAASTRPGIYWVNTYALDTRPLYNLEALSLHEAIPGHHLQISLNQELDLPPFRRHSYLSAFGEGWALYCERLGLEAGFYTDPYSDFGRLTYEMWRACRLVVDTGVHAFGWTRQQMRDYLAANTALSLHEIDTEVDRYIAWPGQALSYKVGELKIRELRARAEESLGERFDLRAFHDVVLEQGSVPLHVLEERVMEWVGTFSGEE